MFRIPVLEFLLFVFRTIETRPQGEGTRASLQSAHEPRIIKCRRITRRCFVLAKIKMPRHFLKFFLHSHLRLGFFSFAFSLTSNNNFRYAPVGRLEPISHRATDTRCAPTRSANSCCVRLSSFLSALICFGVMPTFVSIVT